MVFKNWSPDKSKHLFMTGMPEQAKEGEFCQKAASVCLATLYLLQDLVAHWDSCYVITKKLLVLTYMG